MKRTIPLLLFLSAACAPDTQQEAASYVGIVPAETIKWKLITTWPKNFPALGAAPENFAKLASKMSGGRLEVSVYGAGELVGALEVFDAVANGTAEMGHGAAYYWRGKVPQAVFFTTIPFGMNAQEVNAWLSYGGGLELWRELYEPFGLIPFPGGNSGVQMAGWFNKELNSIEDLRGLKMRIPGLGGEVMRRAGAVPVNLPGGEIYTSLQTGVVDASEWVGPYNDLAFALHQVAEYYYYPGWHEPGAVLEAIVNRDAFHSLSEDLQAIVEVAWRAVNQDVLDEFTARNIHALRELTDEHGTKLRRLPKEVLDRFRDISSEVVAETIDPDDELGQRILNSYMEFHAGVRAYHDISETAYLLTRDSGFSEVDGSTSGDK